MERRALVVGVERYIEEENFPRVSYAQRDAEAIADALTALGYSVTLLLNEHASRGRILSLAKQLAAAGEKDDQLVFFFAGHGAPCEGESFLLCNDTVSGDLQETAVALREVFKRLGASKAKRRMLFLDYCHSGLSSSKEGLGENELRELLKENEPCVLFSSCAQDEISWPSTAFQHGHWTHQLLRALRGEVPEALEEGRLLSGNLQEFLRASVQKEIALQSHGKLQTPKKWGEDDGTFLIADLAPILSATKAPTETGFGEMTRAVFERVEGGSIRSLSGFNKKFHKVPDNHSSATERFVRDIADTEINEEIEEAYQAISRSKQYRNSEIRVQGEGIATPDFKYSLSYKQDQGDCSGYVVTRQLEDLSDPALVEEGWFERYFGGKFDSIELSFSGEVSLEKIIAHAEELPGFNIHTDRHRSYCSIEHPSFEGRIRILPDSIAFLFGSCRPMKELIQGLSKGMNLMRQHEVVAKALE